VSEPQPWRNPRRAPDLSEIRAKTPAPGWLVWLWAWWPAIAWAGVIFSLSTDTFSAQHTGSILEPILRWFMPHLTDELFDTIHYGIRKSAHFTEYFVFCLLLYRGVRGGRQGWRWTWGLERVKKLVFETKPAADSGTSVRSSAILSPAFISVPPL
jgi:hypothetical protein